MGYSDPDYYYQPEHFGLEIVATVDWFAGNGSYEFDDTVIFFHKDSGLYYSASDGGCSCPSPFEDFTAEDLSDMEEAGSHYAMLTSLENRMNEELTGWRYEDNDYRTAQLRAEVTDAMAKIVQHRNAHRG